MSTELNKAIDINVAKLKYILIGIASLYIHSYAFYSFPNPPFEWWVFPTMVVLVGTFLASLIYAIRKIGKMI